MTARRVIAGAAGVAAVAALIYLAGRDGASPLPTPTATPATTAAAGTTGPGLATTAGRGASPALPGPGVEPYPDLGAAGVSTDTPLVAYRRANIYPPTSRPLTAAHADLLRPNQRHEAPRPVDADDDVTYLFTADRYFVLGDEALASSLVVWRAGAPIRAQIKEAYAAVLTPGVTPSAADGIELVFDRDGDALVNRFAPATVPALRRQTAFGVYVEFEYDRGTAPHRAHLDFQYTPAAGIPARFIGTFSDAIVDGSLVIGAGVAVTRDGHYLIDCNLLDASDAPVAWTRFKGRLATGAQTVDLMFFGKVLVDAGASGPFHLSQLRGARFDPGTDPDLEQMPAYAGTYTTRRYELSELSAAEWDSPDKRRMLEFLTEQEQRSVHQGAASGGDPGAPGPGR